MSTTPENKKTNAFSQRHWNEAERLNVIQIYREVCDKIGPNNRIPAPTEAQVAKFNRDLVCTDKSAFLYLLQSYLTDPIDTQNLTGVDMRSASGIQKQWRAIHQDLLSATVNKKMLARATESGPSDQQRRLGICAEHNIQDLNQLVSKLGNGEILALVTRGKKKESEKKKPENSKSQKKLPFVKKSNKEQQVVVSKKRQRDNNDTDVEALQDEIKRLRATVKKLRSYKGVSEALRYAHRYIDEHTSNRGFKFEKHELGN